MRYAIAVILVLGGCADWPDAGGGPVYRTTGPWPELVPVSELVRTLPGPRIDEADALMARAAALRARAAILRRSVTSRDDIEALRARLRR